MVSSDYRSLLTIFFSFSFIRIRIHMKHSHPNQRMHNSVFSLILQVFYQIYFNSYINVLLVYSIHFLFPFPFKDILLDFFLLHSECQMIYTNLTPIHQKREQEKKNRNKEYKKRVDRLLFISGWVRIQFSA